MSKQRPTFLSYRCDECGKYPIQNHRWECNVCEDFDMCGACYEGGVHDTSHACTQHSIQTRRVGSTSTRTANAAASSKASSGKAKEPPSKGKAHTVRMIYETLGLSRKKISANKLELFLSVYNAAIEKWNKGETPPVSLRRQFLYVTELLLSYQTSHPADSKVSAPNLEENYETGLKVLGCVHAQLTIWESDRLGWFGAPVPASVPNYHELIKEPSDLGTIHMLLERGKLLKKVPKGDLEGLKALFKAYCRRVELIWNNAYTFNPEDHPVYLSATRLSLLCVKCTLLCMSCFPSLRKLIATESGFLQFWEEVPDNFKFPICTTVDSTKTKAKKVRSKPKSGKNKRKSAPAKVGPQKKATKRKEAESASARKPKVSSSESEAAMSEEEIGHEAPEEMEVDTARKAEDTSAIEKEVSVISTGVKALHAKLDQWFKFVDAFRFVR